MKHTTIKNHVVQNIHPIKFNKLTKHGYIILDIEPASDNKSVFWLHISEFNGDGTVRAKTDIVNIKSASFNPAKQAHMLEVLNQPFSELVSSKLAMRRQARDFFTGARRRLPIFIYGQALDPALLTTLLRDRMVNLIDLQSVYAKSSKMTALPALSMVAEIMTGGAVSRQHTDVHSPIEDVKMTNVVLQGMMQAVRTHYKQ